MDKNNIDKIGELSIDNLLDMNELIYYKQVKPVCNNTNLVFFDAEKIINIACEIYKEYIAAKDLINQNIEFSINDFPLLNQKKNYFFIRKFNLLKNKVLSDFFSNNYYLNVLVLSLFEQKDDKKRLNKLFKDFYCNYRFISYISKYLNYETSHFIIKEEKILSMLDLEEDTIPDRAYDNNNDNNITVNNFSDYILDYKLFCACKKITDYQKIIIYLAFFLDMNDLQIANKLNVTRQSISKTRKRALMALKNSMGVARDE